MPISTVELGVLHQRALMVPQDPLVFGGRVKAALDPGAIHQNDEIRSLLERFRFAFSENTQALMLNLSF